MAKKIFIIFLSLLSGCIDPVNFKYEEQTRHLVVQAKFSNLPGPHYIWLSYSQPFGSPYQGTFAGARVYVDSEEGEHFEFDYEPESRLYVNYTARAEIGHTYTLHITTPEGQVYQSEPVTIREPVPIDSIHFEEGEEYSTDLKEIQPGYDFNIVFTDPSEEKNFYMWSYSVTYEVLTQPQDYLDYRFVPARNIPKSCCKQCWINETENLMLTGSDVLSDGRQVISNPLFFLPFYRYMNNKIKVRVHQYSVSEQAYDFFSTLEKQRTSTGSVFDPPPTENQGNLFNVNDTSDFVIGYFDASAASVKEITITESDIPYEIKHFIFADDCRELGSATAERPADW